MFRDSTLRRFAPAATVLLLAATHLACASGRPRQMPSRRPPAAVNAPAAVDWSKLPLEVQDSDATLQAIFEQTSASLASLGAEKRSWEGERSAFELRMIVAVQLGPVLRLLRETWIQARGANPELIPFETAHIRRSEQLRDAARRRGEKATLQVAEGHRALGGLLVELLAQVVVADPKTADGVPDPAVAAAWRDRTLEVIRWATTREAVYVSAFEVLGAPWVGSSGATGPWAAQLEPLKRLAGHLVSEGPSDRVTAVEGARLVVDGAPGHATLKGADVSDRGLPGTAGNGLLDSGEILEVTMRVIRTAGVGPLFSESIVPTSIPPCIVVTSPELLLNEVDSGAEASAAAKVLVSGRCDREVRVGYAVQSTHGASTNLTLMAAPVAPGPISVAYLLDADLPGHSAPGDVSRGLQGGQQVELTPTLGGTAGYDGVELRSLAHAEPRDKGYVAFGPARNVTFAPRGEVLALEDDLDMAVAREASLKLRRDNARQVSDALTPFGLDVGGFWFSLEVAMKRAGRAPAAGAGQTPTASGRMARDWVSARVAAESVDQLISGLTSSVDTVISRVEALYGEADWFNPSPRAVLEAMKTLMSLDLLTEPEVTTLLQRFDVPAAVAAGIASSLMSGRSERDVIHPTIAALVDHVDSRASGGVAGRGAMTPASAAHAAEDAFGRSLDAGVGKSWDTPARRLARNVLIAGRVASELAAQQKAIDDMVTLASGAPARARPFPDPVLRAVIGQLGLLTLDVRKAPADLRQILTGHVVTKVLRLERQPELTLLASLSQLLKEEAEKGKAEARQAEADAARGAIGQQRVRRWFRVPVVNGGS
jgi:hypothetical protein